MTDKTSKKADGGPVTPGVIWSGFKEVPEKFIPLPECVIIDPGSPFPSITVRIEVTVGDCSAQAFKDMLLQQMKRLRGKE